MIRGILRIGVVAAGEIVRTGIENKALALLATVLLTIQFLAPAVWAQSEAAQSAGDDRPVADKWALVIGIDRFQDKRIPTLRYSAKDARDFADFLVKKGNFAADHILTLINEQATYQNIEEALGDTWLPRRALSDDLVLIYVSSHGSPREMDVGKDNWLIAHNTNIDKFYSTGIELTSLAATVKKRTGCERVVVILDACNSGAAQTGGGKGLIRPANFDINSIIGDGEVVISSSDCNQRSWESKRYQNGVFTRKLIETLSGGGANRPLNEAFEELKSSVEQEVRFDRKATQTPIFKSKWKGKPLVLAAIPTHPRKSIMPALNTVPEQSTEPAPTETVAVATPDTTIVGIDKDKSTLTGQVSSEHHLLNKKLAFLSVLPPLQYKITMSPTYGVVSQKDFDGAKQFNRMIFNNVRAGLGRSLGNEIVDERKCIDVLTRLSRNPQVNYYSPTADLLKKTAAEMNAQNLVLVQVDEFYFKGQVAWSNVYSIKMTTRIYDGKTGALKSEFKTNKKKQPWLNDSTGWWMNYVANKIVPEVSAELIAEILKRTR